LRLGIYLFFAKKKKPAMDPIKALVNGWMDKAYEIMARVTDEKKKAKAAPKK